MQHRTRGSRLVVALASTLAGGAALLGSAACRDDASAGGGGDGGGSSATTSTATVGSTGIGTGTGTVATASSGGHGAGGDGGGGGSGDGSGSGTGGSGPSACEQGCPPELALCQDGVCVEACDGDRQACDVVADEPLACCDDLSVCCPGPTVGASVCAVSCDTTCPDGTLCGIGELCEGEPDGEAFICTAFAQCGLERACGDRCCPIGARCDEGQCKLADILADEGYLERSMEVVQRSFSESSCELFEGCIGAPGDRRLLKFSLRTPNVGEGDLFLGNTPCELGDDDPACAAVPEDLYVYSSCHDHYHFNSYAEYRLLDAEGRVAATGHKQAFCLLDLEVPQGQQALYDCGFQGIQDGFADIYESHLPCQWIDISDVAAGDYRLEITLNGEHVLAEADYTNNTALIDVHLENHSCPVGGCVDWSATACLQGDPEGRAGNGACDCNGLHEWDAVDCAFCDGCVTTTCPAGCPAGESDGCCGALDTCGLAHDGACNCGGDAAWDANDCERCITADADCPFVDSCPEGCGWEGLQQCDGSAEQEGQNDGYCDCTAYGWDTIDCFACGEDCGQ